MATIQAANDHADLLVEPEQHCGCRDDAQGPPMSPTPPSLAGPTSVAGSPPAAPVRSCRKFTIDSRLMMRGVSSRGLAMTYSHHKALDGMRARGPIVMKVRQLIQPPAGSDPSGGHSGG